MHKPEDLSSNILRPNKVQKRFPFFFLGFSAKCILSELFISSFIFIFAWENVLVFRRQIGFSFGAIRFIRKTEIRDLKICGPFVAKHW